MRAGSKTAAAPHGACIVRNVDLLVAYPGSSVELARDLGCFEHLITMYYDMISSVLRDGYRSTIPFPGLLCTDWTKFDLCFPCQWSDTQSVRQTARA